MAWLEQYRIRRYLKTIAVQILQRLQDGCDQVCTAADWLGEEHVGSLVALELADLGDEIVETAAETGAGNLLDGKALRTQALRIDKVLCLIIGHKADRLS